LKYVTKVLLIVIKGEALPEDWWARLPNGYEAFLKSSMGAALASDRSP
jgi:hypothetical protein